MCNYMKHRKYGVFFSLKSFRHFKLVACNLQTEINTISEYAGLLNSANIIQQSSFVISIFMSFAL